MHARISNPAMSLPGALDALQALAGSTRGAGVPDATLLLSQLRASQINGCSVCTDMHSRELEAIGETGPRLHTVAAWRDTPYFTEAERAALALTEALTRLSDQPEPVSDAIWNDAAGHYTEAQLAAIVVEIATINAFNRINAAVKQETGEWVSQIIHVPETA